MAQIRDDLLEKLTPTIFIGVGGTGLETLKFLKKRNEEVYPKNIPIFEYLSIDSRENPDTGPLDEPYKMALVKNDQVKNAGVVASKIKDTYPEIAKWLPDVSQWTKFKDLARVTEGANQCRTIGRLLFHLSLEKIRTEIRNKVENITSPDTLTMVSQYGIDVGISSDVEIFIICSICGGTGSGQFLDLAYLCRRAVPERNIKVYGILGMPNLFTNVQQGSREINNANAYAALKELDYYMDNKDYDFPFSFGEPSGTGPFDLVYLISSPNETNLSIDSRDAACKMIATGLFGFCGSKIKTAYDEYLTNVKSKLGQFADNRKGNRYPTAYSSFGVASLRFPKNRIIRACSLLRASTLCNLITRHQDDQDVVEEHIRNFMTNFSFRPDALGKILYPNIKDPAERWKSNAENSLRGVDEDKLVNEIESQRNLLESQDIAFVQKKIDEIANQEFLKQGKEKIANEILLYLNGIINNYSEKGLSTAESVVKGVLEDLSEFSKMIDADISDAENIIKQNDTNYAKNLNDLNGLADQSWFKDLFDFDKEEELQKYKDRALSALRTKAHQQLLIGRYRSIKRIYSQITLILSDIKQWLQQSMNMMSELSENLTAGHRKAKEIPARDGLEYIVIRKGGVQAIVKDFDMLREQRLFDDLKNLYNKSPLSEWHIKFKHRTQLSKFLIDHIQPEIGNILKDTDINTELRATEQYNKYIISNLIMPSSPFCTLDTTELKEGGKAHLFEHDILGVADQAIVDSKLKELISGATCASIKDPCSIVLIQTKHAFPIFALGQISEFKRECEIQRAKKDNPCYTVNADLIANFREITPDAKEAVNVYYRAVHAFDLGNMIGFLKTKGKGSVYYYLEIRGDIESGFSISGRSGGRANTKKWLMDKENRSYLERLEGKIKAYLLNLDGTAFNKFYDEWKIFKTKAANRSKRNQAWQDPETGKPDYSIDDEDPLVLQEVKKIKGMR